MSDAKRASRSRQVTHEALLQAAQVVIVRVDGRGAWHGASVQRVALIVAARRGALTVRLKMGLARWSPVPRELERASVIRPATPREAELGLTS